MKNGKTLTTWSANLNFAHTFDWVRGATVGDIYLSVQLILVDHVELENILYLKKKLKLGLNC